MEDIYGDIYDYGTGNVYGTVYQYTIIVSSGQYFGHVVVYSQTVVCNRSTVRAM
jgi:hypothetical protein